MSEEINFTNTGYDKRQYEELVDTNFTQLGLPPSIEETIDLEPTTNDFFIMYKDMFYQIPKFGNNSHEYLIKQSIEYIDFQSDNDEIEALQNEISQLRIQLLEEQKRVIDLQTPESPSMESNPSSTNTY